MGAGQLASRGRDRNVNVPSAPDPISWEQPDLRAPCPLSHPMCHCPELFCFCSKIIPESPLVHPSLFPSRVFTYNSPHLCPRPHRIPQHLSLLACPHLPLLEVQTLPSHQTHLPQTCQPLLPLFFHCPRPGSGSGQPSAALISPVRGLVLLQTPGL